VTERNDRTLDAIGLPRHRSGSRITETAELVVRLMKATDLDRAIRVAPLLAARGWPAGTLGDGGSSTGASIIVVDDDTGPDGERIAVTSTEAAAFTKGRYDNADRNLAILLATIDRALVDVAKLAQRAAGLSADLLAHADDADELPAASGACEACGKVVRSDRGKTPEYLRSGLCNACRMHWDRSGITDRGEWMMVRKAMLRAPESREQMTDRFTQKYGRPA
jgi:hypothetical protein